MRKSVQKLIDKADRASRQTEQTLRGVYKMILRFEGLAPIT
jgi:hypothetical protein